jgi:hypothetical protein
MKGLSSLLLLLFFCLVSCDKKENKDIDTVSPFKAIKNDTDWVSTSSWANFSKTNKSFAISGVKRDPNYYQDEQLSFSFYLADILKSSTVDSFYSKWMYIIGGDVISDSYLIDSTSNNLIQITSLDTVGKQISGTFLIKLVRDKRYSDKGEVFQFKDGQFDLNYTEVE